MKVLDVMDFVTDEIKEIPGAAEEPEGGLKSFGSRTASAISLVLREKEILVFAILQWAVIALGYLLCIQMTDWLPDQFWEHAGHSRRGSLAGYVMTAWTFVCIGVVAYPLGILNGCMGAAHVLRRQGRPSSIAACLQLVLPGSWSLWIFHWIDGFVTVAQMADRMPSKEHLLYPQEKALGEAEYYAWKLGIAGIVPCILVGKNLLEAGKDSVLFVKKNFLEVAKLRAGYSLLCWIIGISTYIGTIMFLMAASMDVENVDSDISHYTFFLWIGIPLLIACAIIVLLLRPIYVLALSDIYADYLESEGARPELPESPSNGVSTLVAFACLCVALAVVYFYRDPLGITALLSTP